MVCMSSLPYFEVDVFSTGPFTGNPLGVVASANGLTTEQMQAIASWTNFSETTFLLQPRNPEADYRVRIFTPASELPFAGHPTLGSAHVWRQLGGIPRNEGVIQQECAAGLVEIRAGQSDYAFATPPLIKEGPLNEVELDQVAEFLGITKNEILAHSWGDNGPGWSMVQLESAEKVRALCPVGSAPLKIGVAGMFEQGEHAYEVRAFTGVSEDPVTGSLNGALAQWMRARNLVPAVYTASQGTARGRAGVIRIQDDAGQLWVGGDVRVCVRGELEV